VGFPRNKAKGKGFRTFCGTEQPAFAESRTTRPVKDPKPILRRKALPVTEEELLAQAGVGYYANSGQSSRRQRMYKAFVSSTFEDLSGHRAEATRSLQAAGFTVDHMEIWPADRDAPSKFSADRLDGCKLCILLVGLRRGTIPKGSSRSITQIEYDEARRRKIDVLAFLLSDQTPVGSSGWNPAFDERTTDTEISRWRAGLRQSLGVGEFGADPKSLRIEAAVARWVVQAESDRATRFRRTITALVVCFFALVACGLLYARHVYETRDLRSQYHSRYLSFHDPVLFNGAKDGQYSVARVLSSYGDLRQNTNLNNEFAGTKFSLDMLANNGQNIHDELAETLRKIVRDGAKVRFILLDYTAENRPSYDAFQYAINQAPAEPRGFAPRVRAELERLQRESAIQRSIYKGTLEVRWNQRPLLYTMWIRDWSQTDRGNALAHLGIHFYCGQAYWPDFRVSGDSADGGALLDNMHQEFEYAWATSALSIPQGSELPRDPKEPTLGGCR
jgi:hypothetical protein